MCAHAENILDKCTAEKEGGLVDSNL